MVSIGELGQPEELTQDVDVGWGTKVRMTWDPELFTSSRDDAIDDEDRHAIARRICDVVKEWELTGPLPTRPTPVGGGEMVEVGAVVAKDEPIPLDPEVVAFFSFPVLSGILNGLQVASLPNVQTRSGSRGRGSTRTGSKWTSKRD